MIRQTSMWILSWVLLLFLLTPSTFAQVGPDAAELNYSALSWRGVSTGFASGRISDIAIHPDDENLWYVAVGSGGVWKTENAGITWTPIFDRESSYSIGSVTIDPNNPNIIWSEPEKMLVAGMLALVMEYTKVRTPELLGPTWV